MRKDPSVTAPVISDSIYGIKRKIQKNVENQNEEVKNFVYLFVHN